MNRREFLSLCTAIGAAVALAGCGHPPEPYFVSQAQAPEFYLPGIAQYYATTCGECAAACGLAVRVIGARPKKVEGNERHPVSHGAHCLRAEVALQVLYHPQRLPHPMQRQGGRLVALSSWDAAIAALARSFDRGRGLWITGPLGGTAGTLLVEAARRTGSKIWVLDLAPSVAWRMTSVVLGGAPRLPYLDLASVDYVLDFGSDFLAASALDNVRHGFEYAKFRRGSERSRRGVMVSFAPRMTMTAASADIWVPIRPGSEGFLALALLGLLDGTAPASLGTVPPGQAAAETGLAETVIHRLAARLRRANRATALAGYDASAWSNGFWTLAAIGALDRTLRGSSRADWDPDTLLPLPGQPMLAPSDVRIDTRGAVEALAAGHFSSVWVNGVNPTWLLPPKTGVAAAIGRVETFALTPFLDETAALAAWVLPTSSMFERWEDASVDAPTPVYGLRQPLASPVADARGPADILLDAFASSRRLRGLLRDVGVAVRRAPSHRGGADTSGDAGDGDDSPPTVKDLLRSRFHNGSEWARALERGGLFADAAPGGSRYAEEATLPPPLLPAGSNPLPAGKSFWEGLSASPPTPATAQFVGTGDFRLLPYPSPIWNDGSRSNCPWIPETPDPMARAVWTTWAEINATVCKKLGIERLDLVKLTSPAGSIVLPVLPVPTVHEDVVAIPIGLGHTTGGPDVEGVGSNPSVLVEPVYQEGTGELAWGATRVSVEKTGKKGWVTTFDQRVYGKRAMFAD